MTKSKFDINSPVYNKIYPTEELVLEYLSDLEIYRHYIKESFTIGKAFNSPLQEDNIPSFGIYHSKKYNGRLFFKDHRGPTGSSVRFVQLLYNLGLKETLEMIIIDFGLEDKFIIGNTSYKPSRPVEFRMTEEERKNFKKHTKLDLKISTRKWKLHDRDYWMSNGIAFTTLEAFNVVPIDYYWMYGHVYKADKHAYAYKEWKDGILNYKIYQPFRSADKHKFLNGYLDGTFSGWELLPNHEVDLIIITKSTKDSMFLYQRGYYATSPQGEGYIFKPQVMDILKSKTKRIVTFYDHDEAGIKSAERNRQEFGFEFVTTCDSRSKDITDFYKKYGVSETLELLNILFK